MRKPLRSRWAPDSLFAITLLGFMSAASSEALADHCWIAIGADGVADVGVEQLLIRGPLPTYAVTLGGDPVTATFHSDQLRDIMVSLRDPFAPANYTLRYDVNFPLEGWIGPETGFGMWVDVTAVVYLGRTVPERPDNVIIELRRINTDFQQRTIAGGNPDPVVIDTILAFDAYGNFPFAKSWQRAISQPVWLPNEPGDHYYFRVQLRTVGIEPDVPPGVNPELYLTALHQFDGELRGPALGYLQMCDLDVRRSASANAAPADDGGIGSQPVFGLPQQSGGPAADVEIYGHGPPADAHSPALLKAWRH